MSKRTGKKQSAPITAYLRLKQDFSRLMKDPVPYIIATPQMDNILKWHYVVTGPEDSPYEGGYYHGKLVFPHDFPFKPPSIYMLTPNGRFKCNTRLCLSISDFHPDTWNPAWSVSTILTGLLSFMLEDQPTLGSITTTVGVKRQYAQMSLKYNLADAAFVEIFPDLTEELKEELEERRRDEERRGSLPRSSGDPTTTHSTDDSPGVMNHVILLVAIGALAYIVHTVIKTTLSD